MSAVTCVQIVFSLFFFSFKKFLMFLLIILPINHFVLKMPESSRKTFSAEICPRFPKLLHTAVNKT